MQRHLLFCPSHWNRTESGAVDAAALVSGAETAAEFDVLTQESVVQAP